MKAWRKGARRKSVTPRQRTERRVIKMLRGEKYHLGSRDLAMLLFNYNPRKFPRPSKRLTVTAADSLLIPA